MKSLDKKVSNYKKKNRTHGWYNKNFKEEVKIPQSYRVYIKSIFWKKRKNQYFYIHGKKCFVCGSGKYVQLHHKIYKDFGNELDCNLVALCRFHHSELHKATKLKQDMTVETNDLIEKMRLHQSYFERNKKEYLSPHHTLY